MSVHPEHLGRGFLHVHDDRHTQTPATRLDHRRSNAIGELLEGDRVCLDIVRYLVRNSEAADTPGGIAEWWIGGDITRTAEALARLHAHGVVRSRLVHGATYVYMLTKNRRVRETLREYVDSVAQIETADPAERAGVTAHDSNADAPAEVGEWNNNTR